MQGNCWLRPGFHPLSIGLMVAGFIVFWPLGLIMLAYMLWGERMRAGWSEVRPDLARAARRAGFQAQRHHRYGGTGNTAFDAYREAELRRLEEERAALERMREEFDEFLRKLRHAKDQEEFDRFKASRNNPAG